MTQTQRSSPLRATPRIADVWEGLMWPRLLLAPRLACRPGRIGLALIAVVLVVLILRIPEIWLGANAGPAKEFAEQYPHAVEDVVWGLFGLDVARIGRGISEGVYRIPRRVAGLYPWSLAAVIVPLLAVWAVFGGAICRMAASEFAQGVRTSWTKGLGFAIGRPMSLLLSLLLPLVIAGAMVLALALGGWVLLGLGWVQVIGGALYGLALVLGVLVVITLVGLAVGLPLLPAAVVCEGTDAIDAVQRSYAYVLDRPVRVVAYSVVLLAQLVVFIGVFGLFAAAVVDVTAWAGTLFCGPSARSAVLDAAGGVLPTTGTAWPLRAMAQGVRFWSLVPGLFVVAMGVSFYFSAASLLYLNIREIADGQDASDLWSPGMVGGTQAAETQQPARAE